MVIDPVGPPAVPVAKPAEAAGSPARVPVASSASDNAFPNPRITFDAALGLVVIEFHNPLTQDVTRYPDTSGLPPPHGHDSTA